ncbi:hypothetical protein OPV22_019200 [Ensete ventricosum]|uniref:Uncharacterized protein n=1 Tax=Ensete ventricosum TaxID=4639 RepID=A0AAV8PGZ3_ENSVE|nr:hypothetical protein OPV22_019200 [Ensete ventricosum]
MERAMEKLKISVVQDPVVAASCLVAGGIEHVSDDSWCDDGLLNEISDADLNREQKRRYDQFYTFIWVIEMVYLQERKLPHKRASTLALSNLQAVVTNGELLEASQVHLSASQINSKRS